MRYLIPFLLCLSAWGATGDITAVRVIASTCTAGASCNGWVAEIDLEGLSVGGTYDFGLGANNNPSTAKIVFTVTSPGYDTSGNTTTIQRTVYGTQWLRKPYPDQASKDEAESGGTLTVRVALSDFIYVSDTATVTIASGFYTGSNAVTDLSVTNNSTLAYPKPVGRWAWPGWEKITGDFLLESVVFHRFARNGKPVAAVKYTCTDTSANSVTATVNDMTVSARTGDANKVLVYAATMSPTALTQGQVVTCNFVAYPWVGDSGAKLDSTPTTGDGFAQPDERLGPLLWVNDKSGTYGEAFAVVDPTNGNASAAATWVASSRATAEANYVSSSANSYTTIGYAAQALKAYNNANYGRNEPGGGTILLATATNVYPGTTPGSDLGAMQTWLTITKVTGSSGAISSSTLATLNVTKQKFSDIAITSTAQILGNASVTPLLWLDGCTLNITGSPGLYAWKLGHATRNSITALTNGFQSSSTYKAPYALLRGNSASSASTSTGLLSGLYAMLGNANLTPILIATGNAAGQQISDNAVLAYNTAKYLNNSWLSNPATTAMNGLAIVQNAIELTSTAALMSIGYDATTANNVLLWYNTMAGNRLIIGYNSTGSTALLKTNFGAVGNIVDSWNNKDDTFTTADGARTGSWSVGYNVGMYANHKRASESTEWFGEFDGLWTIKAGTLGFVDDNSYNNGGGGSATGNGDYHLTSSASALSLVPSGGAVLPYDLDGVARRNDGTGAAGAYEYATATRKRVVVISQ